MGYKIEAAMLLLLVAVLSVTSAQHQEGRCLTPHKQQGDCRNLAECPELLSLLKTYTKANYIYLQQSRCGFEGLDMYVCCPSSNNENSYVPTLRPTATTTQRQPNGGNNQQQKPANNELLPANCGRDESNSTMAETYATDIWEYPWMALLEYDTPDGVRLGCSGVLINNRYVLTAAHCVKGLKIRPTWSLKRVRLGEYDLDTELDCIHNSVGDRICSDPPVTVTIEEHIVHEHYDPRDMSQRYDIALLRLSRDVPFTAFIRPVCLPRSSHIDPARWFALTGWGRAKGRTQPEVKLQMGVPFFDNRQCAATYWGLGVKIGEGQMCAGGRQSRVRCYGDLSGPLMQQKKDDGGTTRWYAVGFPSFGPGICDTERVPAVYTRLFDYIPWLTRKLRQ